MSFSLTDGFLVSLVTFQSLIQETLSKAALFISNCLAVTFSPLSWAFVKGWLLDQLQNKHSLVFGSDFFTPSQAICLSSHVGASHNLEEGGKSAVQENWLVSSPRKTCLCFLPAARTHLWTKPWGCTAAARHKVRASCAIVSATLDCSVSHSSSQSSFIKLLVPTK